MLRRLASVLSLSLLTLAGCGSKERVELSATVTRASLEIQEGAFGTFLSGTFELRLELGPEAPGSTTAELESVALVRASDGLELVATLPLAAGFAPVDLNPGDVHTETLSLDATDPVDTNLGVEICAEPVAIRGSLSDTRSAGRSTTFGSPAVTPDGC